MSYQGDKWRGLSLLFTFLTSITFISFRIIESKNVNFPVGKLVFCNCGWRTLTLINIKNFPNRHDLYLLPDEMNSFSPSFALGCFGNPGNSAFYGFFELCQPQKRDVVVVSGAAGAVGSLVGQLSKIKECKMVIGFAGSDEKCRWLETEMGFDKAINYKNDNVKEELKKAAPDGVDCYFDNVGGVLSSIVIGDNMRMFGRISVCGSISNYNDNTILVPAFNKFHRQNLRMEGFMNYRWIKKWLDEGMFEMIQYVKDGKIKCQETITEHFENTPQAFVDMMRGKNFGKAIVKI